MGRIMLEQDLMVRDKLKTVDEGSADGVFYRGKKASVHYFCRDILVNVFSRHMTFKQEDTSALDIPEAAF